MKHSRVLFKSKRGEDICHRAFRQTLDLLTVTDRVLEELCSDCPSLPDHDELVLKGLNEIAQQRTKDGVWSPAHVLLLHGTGTLLSGIVYALGDVGYSRISEPLTFEASTFPALPLGAQTVVVLNAEDYAGGSDAFQSLIHPEVRRAVGVPIRNFITYRIAGDRPGAIIAFNYPARATRYEAQVLSTLAITLGSLWTLSTRIGRADEGFLYLVGALARASEVNDDVTGDHILRVSRHVEFFALAAGYSPADSRVIAYSSQLHDVGKIHTPREILRKTGPLDAPEAKLMRQHTLQGERIIGDAPRLAVARKIAGCHHENWDGSGYPRKLAGRDIPREARLVKIVDVYEALRAERPYKPPYSHETACQVLLNGDARVNPQLHFDPELLSLFLSMHGEFQRIHAEIRDWS